jgi:hypothetical protein
LPGTTDPISELEGGDVLTVEQAMRRPDCIHWQKAPESEYNSLIESNTWNTVNLSQGHKTICVKWVLKVERFPDSGIIKLKAQLVVKGYSRVRGLDCDQLFAPIVKKTSLPSSRGSTRLGVPCTRL